MSCFCFSVRLTLSGVTLALSTLSLLMSDTAWDVSMREYPPMLLAM